MARRTIGTVALILTALVAGVASPVRAQQPTNEKMSTRAQRLAASLDVRQPVVPGVIAGWEGDPRAESWVSRCDAENDGSACWLAAIALNAGSGIDFIGGSKWPVPDTALQYLARGCELGAAEACADLGDLSRFGLQDWRKALVQDPHRPIALAERMLVIPHNLRKAADWYRRSCELDSAYGCYLWAEYLDRGIGTPADHAAARQLFAETCSAGMTLGCLRANQAQATVYPFKLFSAADSTCAKDDECWKECAAGTWGACDRVSISFHRSLLSEPGTQQQLSATLAKACAAGADWGCTSLMSQGPSRPAPGSAADKALGPMREASSAGCAAGSATACRDRCAVAPAPDCADLCYAAGGRDTDLERQAQIYAFPRCAGKTIEARWRECVVGNPSACAEPIAALTDTQFTPDEAKAYAGARHAVLRMVCNAGDLYRCLMLSQELQAAQAEQLARAYAYGMCARAERPECGPLFQALNPLERAMASEWYPAMPSWTPPVPGVVSALEQSCGTGLPRACHVLGRSYWALGTHREATGDRELIEGLVQQIEIDGQSYEEALAECRERPIKAQGGMILECDEAKTRRKFEESQKRKRRELEQMKTVMRGFKITIDPAMRARAYEVLERACSVNYEQACRTKDAYARTPDVFYGR
ncbi:MAG TPA: hypothetical protein VIA80_19325 [Hyphomonadaceae bacterium]